MGETRKDAIIEGILLAREELKSSFEEGIRNLSFAIETYIEETTNENINLEGRKEMENVEHCDYGHPSEEVRRLPTGGGGNMIVCREHYAKEIMFRFTRNKEMGRKGFMLPRWDDLEIYSSQ